MKYIIAILALCASLNAVEPTPISEWMLKKMKAPATPAPKPAPVAAPTPVSAPVPVAPEIAPVEEKPRPTPAPKAKAFPFKPGGALVVPPKVVATVKPKKRPVAK